ncbi:MAG: tetratricopeptide repeat protein [Acidobacteria bacterium]|nr:tetratricopeptide repeat protein [Acidobacteriota bacterium]
MELSEILALYEQNRFLEAYRRCAHLWTPETDTDTFPIEDLVLFSRLAFRIGSPRLSRWLQREAARRAPRHPQVRCYALHVGRRRADLLDTLLDFEAEPELDTDDPELKASWLGSIAMHWTVLRDFGNAFACLDRAKALRPEDAWVLSSEANVLLAADRWEEACDAARRSWMASPGKPWTARVLGQAMIKCGRLPEAARRIADAAEAGESVEMASYAAWLLCAHAEALDGADRGRLLGRASALVDRLADLAPRPDRETRDMVARARLDIADLAEDRAALERWAEETGSPFYRAALKNLRRNPAGRRHLLPFWRVSQKHDACMPTSMAAVLHALGMDLSADAIAGEISFGGTTAWDAADWLEGRGLAVRHFRATPGIARELVLAGVPFVLTLQAESSGHAVAAVGVDEAAGTLLYHDPSFPRLGELLLDGLGADESPLGPRGLAAVPRDRAAVLDRIIPPDEAKAVAAFHEHGRALRDAGPPAARRVVSELARELPGHVVTRYLETFQKVLEGHVREAFTSFQGLLNEHPGCLLFRRSLVQACRSLGNTALLRETLAELVEKGRLPGVQAAQDWWYPPETYVCQYADLLAASEPGRQRALRLLRTVLARGGGNEEIWYTLGRLTWTGGPTPAGRLAYRAAACLADEDDANARTWCNVLRLDGREEDGLGWLEDRARRLATSPRPLGPWFTWVDALEDFGHPERTAAALGEALQTHGDDPEWVQAAVPFWCRLGRWEEAEAGLRRLADRPETAGFHEARLVFHRLRGEWENVRHHAGEWVRLSPFSTTARRHLLDAAAVREGNAAAVDLARRWVAEHPGHDEMEELLHDRLAGAETEEERLRLVRERVARNAEDGWAWRELALIRIGEFELRPVAERPQLAPEIERVLSECDRTAPRNPSTLRMHASWAEARGIWRTATDHWLRAAEAEPEDFYAYRRAWECAAGLPEADRQKLFDRIEILLMRCIGRLHIARDLAFMIAKRFGLAAAEAAVTRWRQARPDDPEVLEAVADLWLDYGQGRSDAERARELLAAAVERFPYHVDLRLSLAQACRALGQDEQAEGVLLEINRRHPGNTGVQLQLSRLRERREDQEGAERWLNAARDVAPFSSEIWKARIGYLMRQDRGPDARALALEGLAADPRNVFRRECALDVLSDLGEAREAVALARDGVQLDPSGAWLWLLLARNLASTGQPARQKEAEACFRRSLELNAGLFDAADELAMLLAQERRLEEAVAVLEQVRRYLPDPSPVDGRLAWLQRLAGKREPARKAMSAAVAAAPWYGWGWEKLITWLQEDKAWDDARKALCPSPPAMSAQPWFRKDRLLLLARAGLPPAELEAEWDRCLADYPEDTNLRLECFDSFQELKLHDKAAAVLDTVLERTPGDPFALARYTRVLSDRKQTDELLDVALRISFDTEVESEWPARHAWSTAEEAGLLPEIRKRVKYRMELGEEPSVHAFSLMALLAGKREKHRGGQCRSALQCAFFRGAGAVELEELLELADRSSWKGPDFRAKVLEELVDLGYHRRVIRYGQRHPDRINETEPWAQVGRALVELRPPLAAKFLAPWKQRTDVKMWMVSCFVMSLTYYGATRYREVMSACRDALRYLPHDHTARFLAHVLAETSILLGDLAVFRDAWSRYGGYFDGEVLKGEFFPKKWQHLLKDLPVLAQALERGDKRTFDTLSKRLRKNNVLFGRKSFFQNTDSRKRSTWAIGGVALGSFIAGVAFDLPALTSLAFTLAVANFLKVRFIDTRS